MPLRVPADAAIVTAAQMREAEAAVFASGVSQTELMERAGLAVAREVRRFAGGAPVLVLAGPGNNGGDAYVVARHVAAWGGDVVVAALGVPKAGAAAEMAARWKGGVTSLEDARARPVLVDGLFGTGITRPLDPEVTGPLKRLCEGAGFRIAIDLPSGFDTDSGERLESPARADVTVALGALKSAHVLFPASGACGTVVLADIGVPVPDVVRSIARPILSAPGAEAHKYSRGMVVVVAGEMPGAARLAATAALHGGAGYVVLAGAQPDGQAPAAVVQRRVDRPEALAELLRDERIGSVLIGPGLGRGEAARAMLEVALACPHRLVLDGDALTLLGTRAEGLARRAETVLTPHGGEFARMFGADGGSKIDRTRIAARASGAIVVHKGADTVAATPSGDVRVLSWGSPWLATAGTGDVLAGLTAAAAPGLDGASAAIWLHARAATHAGPGFAADDLARAVPMAMREAV
ncbi:MAG: bifunctional ADP-dependent NAD(P)H-hydrate dehydratase/NAD(P)H-hydrate epimerase [Alphaproteobacteria bacterium HGW-Alphaproteobacteria-15]|nr:MAG: bifunctional ADP-dependent NAD(P)H-hydrate dehydratase/NAD(P)H-hydrate epimerase [Alphaproteobacteria bacterium HGW-Alphaproteobacteria-15]